MQKPGTFLDKLSNEDILWWCKTGNIHQFIPQQQHDFLAHVIWGDNKMTKCLLFNDEGREETGHFVTLI